MRFILPLLLFISWIFYPFTLLIGLEAPQLTYKEVGRGYHPQQGPILQVHLIPKGFPANSSVKISMTRLNNRSLA